jgi:GTP-binding protein
VTARFVASAAREEQFIRDGKQVVVFAGRSNVGKSSVINLLTGVRNLAKVGKSPGKTAHVNYFAIDETLYFADLPGYGYAKVSHAEKLRWAALLEAFFAKPENITFGVLVTDARHKPTALDLQMAGLFRQAGIPFLTIANKVDKLKATQVRPSLEQIAETLELTRLPLPVSGETGTGKQEVLRAIYRELSEGRKNGTPEQ